MGTPAFAVPCVDKLFHTSHSISAVVTAPDKPAGRGLKLSESEVKKFVETRFITSPIKILQPLNLKEEGFISEIKNLSPDLIVVVAFKILPREVFTIPRYGSINLHASLLPRYRGAAPVNWALIKGEKETGVTTFFLEEKVDTGNIIMQNKCQITAEDDAGTLHDKLSQLGADIVLSTVDSIEEHDGKPPLRKQDNSLASPAPKITPELCKINWSDTAHNIQNLIRGLSPYPGAHTFYNGRRLKILKTKFSLDLPEAERRSNPGNQTNESGKIRIEDNSLLLTCSDSLLEILDLQLEGKKRISACDFLKGNKFEDGDRFL